MYWYESRSYSDPTANKDEWFEMDVRRKGNRYEVKLPWKENTQPSFNGYQLSESCLRSLHHKLRKEPSLLAEYDAIIQGQMKSGRAEKVPDKYLTNQEMSQNYYLPHMAVIRKDRKTTKVRVVYDGSANASKQKNLLMIAYKRVQTIFNTSSTSGRSVAYCERCFQEKMDRETLSNNNADCTGMETQETRNPSNQRDSLKRSAFAIY